MRIQDIREKNSTELQGLLSQYRESLRALRFGIAERETKNHQEYSHVRRDVARVLTILRERNDLQC